MDNAISARVERVKKNTTSKRLFVVPAALTAGTYRLGVRQVYSRWPPFAGRGESVVTDLFILRPGLAGVWRDADDVFDPTRHRGQINLSAGTFLRRAEPEMKFTLVRAGRALSEPFPETLEDFASDKTDDTLTKGGIARLSGSSLKHDPADPTQGVFLVRSNGTITRVDTYKTNKPSEQLFVVPAALTAGTYRLEVRSKLRGSDNLRTGTLAALTVA